MATQTKPTTKAPSPPIRASRTVIIERRVTQPFEGLLGFIREQGVVGLCVGFVIGAAANTLVKSIVTNIFNPVIGVLTGGIDLSQKSTCIKMVGKVCKDNINYGQAVSDLLTFLVVLTVVYIVLKSLSLDKLDKPKA